MAPSNTPLRLTSSLYTICVKEFDSLLQSLRTAFYPEADQLQEQLGRFRVWAHNVSAHRTGRMSLDYRLREAPLVRQKAMDMLQELENVLQAVREIIASPPGNGDCNSLHTPTSDSDSDQSLIDDLDALYPNTYLEEAVIDIGHIITCLFRLTISIQNPAPRDKPAKFAAIDVSHFEEYDINHVAAKFPSAPPYLVKRLGRANTRRRQILKYMEQHHQKLAREYEQPSQVKELHCNLEDVEQNSVPGDGSTRDAINNPEAEDVSLSAPDDTNTVTNTNTTVTTFVEDAFRGEYKEELRDDSRSVTSFATSAGSDIAGSRLRVPAPPDTGTDDEDEPFQCPYCFLITVRRNWRSHVFRDLRPYSCTFENCFQSENLFVSRHEWFNHEMEFHRREWTCRICFSTPVYSAREQFEKHIEDSHHEILSGDGTLPLPVISHFEHSCTMMQDCPLCQTRMSPERLRRHLASHMRQLALWTLPNLEDGSSGQTIESSEDDDDSDRSKKYGHADIKHLNIAPVDKSLEGHSDRIMTVAFSPDGKILASGSLDETIRLWDPVTGALLSTLKGYSGGSRTVVFSPDGKMLASGSLDKTIRLWDPATGALLATLKGHSNIIVAMAFSPDGRMLASGSYDKTIRLWDPATGDLRATLDGHSDIISALVFSPDGKMLAYGSTDETIRLWDPATGVLLATLKDNYSGVSNVVFSPNGKMLASGSYKKIGVWDPVTGALHATLEGHYGGINTVVFSPDGKMLASGSYDKTIGLWDPATGALHATLKGHYDGVNTVAFSLDGKILASGSDDNTIRLWDPATGDLRATLDGHSDIISALVFSPDGKMLASGSYDKKIRLWDPATGAERRTPQH